MMMPYAGKKTSEIGVKAAKGSKQETGAFRECCGAQQRKTHRTIAYRDGPLFVFGWIEKGNSG
jgi:hypothetical protein